MGQRTSIQWTRSSRNAWAGCTKVGPGCDHCYAETFQRWIRGINVVTKQANNWGPGAPRVPHLDGFVKDLQRWNRYAAKEKRTGALYHPKNNRWEKPGFWPVFVNSHSDTFDNDVPDAWREVIFDGAEACPNLTLQLVTKRIGNVHDMIPQRWRDNGFPPNVWLIITVVNQEELDRDFSKLISLKGVRVRGLSMEPLLGSIDLRSWLKIASTGIRDEIWGVVGGESDQGGHKARVHDVSHTRSIVQQLHSFGYAAFVKQLGSNPWDWTANAGFAPGVAAADWNVRYTLKDDHGGDPTEWPDDLRVQEFPRL